MTVIATIILLGVLIFVHELGHFIAARSVGVGVERFSIGFGPRLAGFERGGTEYVISAIPLGGYVKLQGMHDEVMEYIEGGEGEDGEPGTAQEGGDAARVPGPGDFDGKPVWVRAWVFSAGVIMNMVFAFVTYAAVAAWWGSPEMDTTRFGTVVEEQLPEGARGFDAIPAGATLVRIGDREVGHWGQVRDALLEATGPEVTVAFRDPDGEVTVTLPDDGEGRRRVFGALRFWNQAVLSAVAPGSPAARGGLEPGDRIMAVDDVPIRIWHDFQEAIRARPDTRVELTLIRDGGEMRRSVTPDAVEGVDPATGEVRTIGQIGVQARLPGVAYTRRAPVEAVRAGWNETVAVTGLILGILRDLVTGQLSPRNLGSIVAIGEASGQAVAEGIPVYLRFMALFSVNLAILNLLPIPVLDGGHLLFLGIEAVRGRPLSVEARVRWSQVGFVVLIGIMVLALGNDFLRLLGL